MVMRNRHDDAGMPNWRDDLPPSVRKRFGKSTSSEPVGNEEASPNAEGRETSSHAGIVRDLTRLAALFLVVAVANLLFLLIAITFLSGSGPLGR
jgi:hypothetical protein